MENKAIEKAAQSPFAIVIGILAGLILNEFIKKASTALTYVTGLDLLVPKVLVVFAASLWVFYTIYGTITWLMFVEYSPRRAGLPSSYPKLIFLRFLEFLPFLCLHNIFHTGLAQYA